VSTWGDVAYERNQRDVGDYDEDEDRGDVRRSIWDGAEDERPDPDDVDEQKRQQAEEDRAARDTGWFGDKTHDILGDPWRQGGRYPGGPDDPYARGSQSRDRVKRGSYVRTDRIASAKRRGKRKFNKTAVGQNVRYAKDLRRDAKRKKKKIFSRGFWF
jgi:hypothetical protein